MNMQATHGFPTSLFSTATVSSLPSRQSIRSLSVGGEESQFLIFSQRPVRGFLVLWLLGTMELVCIRTYRNNDSWYHMSGHETRAGDTISM